MAISYKIGLKQRFERRQRPQFLDDFRLVKQDLWMKEVFFAYTTGYEGDISEVGGF